MSRYWVLALYRGMLWITRPVRAMFHFCFVGHHSIYRSYRFLSMLDELRSDPPLMRRFQAVLERGEEEK